MLSSQPGCHEPLWVQHTARSCQQLWIFAHLVTLGERALLTRASPDLSLPGHEFFSFPTISADKLAL